MRSSPSRRAVLTYSQPEPVAACQPGLQVGGGHDARRLRSGDHFRDSPRRNRDAAHVPSASSPLRPEAGTVSAQRPVEVRGLVKRYGDLAAVDHVDLTVEPGDVYGFLGPNGAGKTTTMRML